MKKAKQAKGFTIIEVVLVLAIAALIFLMVFIAFPALQRSQRNTARKNAVSTVLSAVTDYQSANQGKLPLGSTSLDDYTGELKTAGYTITPAAAAVASDDTSSGAAIDTVVVWTAAVCDGGKVDKGKPRQYTVTTLLEGGSAGATIPYCLQG